jgi:hypothetical protein
MTRYDSDPSFCSLKDVGHCISHHSNRGDEEVLTPRSGRMVFQLLNGRLTFRQILPLHQAKQLAESIGFDPVSSAIFMPVLSHSCALFL